MIRVFPLLRKPEKQNLFSDLLSKHIVEGPSVLPAVTKDTFTSTGGIFPNLLSKMAKVQLDWIESIWVMPYSTSCHRLSFRFRSILEATLTQTYLMFIRYIGALAVIQIEQDFKLDPKL